MLDALAALPRAMGAPGAPTGKGAPGAWVHHCTDKGAPGAPNPSVTRQEKTKIKDPEGGDRETDGANGDAERHPEASLESLPERYPLGDDHPVTRAIRAKGGDPLGLWAKLRPLVLANKVRPDDMGSYMVGMAKGESRKAAERIGGRADPGVLAQAREMLSSRQLSRRRRS
jgi:hypothetical protein